MHKKEIQIEEIKEGLAKRSYYDRSIFLESDKYNPIFFEYYVSYILEYSKTGKNNKFLSDLICFTIDNKIFDKRIINTWYNLMIKSRNTIVLLCLLDYFNICPINRLPETYEKKLHFMLKQKNYRIITNQIYINLLLLDESNNEIKEGLINSIKNTKDYRSILRIISIINIFDNLEFVIEIKKTIRSLNLMVFDESVIENILENTKL